MNKSKINYWIDLVLALSFIVCFFTGLIKWPGLIKIVGVSAYKTLHIRNISIIHDISGLIMGILIITHFMLHLKWVAEITKSFFRKNN